MESLISSFKCPHPGLCRLARAAAVLLGGLLLLGPIARGQDVTALRINEILASNKKTPPIDADNEFEDLLEIYNPTDKQIQLTGLLLANGVTKDAAGKYHPVTPWQIPAGSILPKGFVTIFCDADAAVNQKGEAHASFHLSKNGEVVALFTAQEEVIDLVVFPRTASDTSYGRFPDGSGDFCHTTTPSFKNKSVVFGGSLTAQNQACDNIPPEIDLHATKSIADARGANPPAGTPVPLEAEVWDEKEGPVASASILFSVNGGSPTPVAMTLDPEATALLTRPDPLDPTGPLLPDKNRSIWRGVIPGLDAGSLVTFILTATDAEGATSSDPKEVCTAIPTTTCKAPYQYRVNYQYQGPLVLNEIAPLNISIKQDPTDLKFDDYLELCSSADLTLDGLWLSGNPFRPQGWQFPLGSKIKAGEHLIVWCDNSKKDTDPTLERYHTNFNLDHTGESIFIFDTDANGLGLIDGFKYGLTDPDLAWSRIPDCDRSAPFVGVVGGSPGVSNSPAPPEPKFIRGDTDGSGGIDLTDAVVTLNFLFLAGPALPCPDAADFDDSGGLDLTDPISVLLYLFQSGPTPMPPFPDRGPDPTADSLGTCVSG
jgi:hypothetical protein